MLVACGKEADKPATPAEPAATVQALPSIYTQPAYAEAAKALDDAAQTLLKTAKSTKDVNVLGPAVKNFVEKRMALTTGIPDVRTRMYGLREVMQKNVSSPEDRRAFTEAMAAYYKAQGAVVGAPSVPARNTPAKP